ncbi:Ketosteroid isomerase homolog [Streptomyces zhaozhouensis]|uniref:Ketosteroid isomerase homolog n=2 Tax=Streptomyces zhaozhouensis TaxID=1300267 RepID=A0A286DU43_9ACTN|nr:Ketosteroid isomerase homolog [Streptomyces zhaozhouensis]
MSDHVETMKKHLAQYADAFNSGDFETMDAFYTEEAVAVWEPGKPLTGQARRDFQREYLLRKPRMTATLRESFVTDDTALLIVDWVIEIPTDGAPEREQGVGVDVLRLGDDGVWRYAVDEPFGQES